MQTLNPSPTMVPLDSEVSSVTTPIQSEADRLRSDKNILLLALSAALPYVRQAAIARPGDQHAEQTLTLICAAVERAKEVQR